ncbi:hypothetical protein AgCh_028936 [Apium graveolens]
MYPLGGSAERLGLVDPVTGECLPAAMLPYYGRTLLEGLIRDLQSVKNKWILGAQYAFPILKWGPEYTLKTFKSDIVVGLTIASLAIPQGISYAKLANLPPIVCLCVFTIGSIPDSPSGSGGSLQTSVMATDYRGFFEVGYENSEDILLNFCFLQCWHNYSIFRDGQAGKEESTCYKLRGNSIVAYNYILFL